MRALASILAALLFTTSLALNSVVHKAIKERMVRQEEHRAENTVTSFDADGGVKVLGADAASFKDPQTGQTHQRHPEGKRKLMQLDLPSIAEIEKSKGWVELCKTTMKVNASFSLLADKYAVKDWVQTKQIKVPQTYFGAQKESDITLAKLEKLPHNFVMKGTQGSGMTVIANGTDYTCHAGWDPSMGWCPAGGTNAGNSKEARLTFLQETCKKWLSVDFGKLSGEVFYSRITPRCIFEEFIAQDDDYKVHVYHGTPLFVQVDTGRFTGCDRQHGAECSGHRQSYYTPSWDKIDMNWGPGGHSAYEGGKAAKPAHLSQLIKTAAALGAGFPFVRVDLYINGGDVFFSELTQSPADCKFKFEPDIVDAFLGRLISEPNARIVPDDLLSLVSQTHED